MFDEPTTGLDQETSENIMTCLSRRSGAADYTALIVNHDIRAFFIAGHRIAVDASKIKVCHFTARYQNAKGWLKMLSV
ncbi:MAG: hypothetical protein U1F27_03110 [Turneriella sp.]